MNHDSIAVIARLIWILHGKSSKFCNCVAHIYSQIVCSGRIVTSIDDKGDRCISGVFTIIVCVQEGKIVTSNKICAEIVIGIEGEGSVVGIEVSERTVGRKRESV